MHEGQLDSKSVTMKNIHDVLKDAEGRDNAVHSLFVCFFRKCDILKGLDHPKVISEYLTHNSLRHIYILLSMLASYKYL